MHYERRISSHPAAILNHRVTLLTTSHRVTSGCRAACSWRWCAFTPRRNAARDIGRTGTTAFSRSDGVPDCRHGCSQARRGRAERVVSLAPIIRSAADGAAVIRDGRPRVHRAAPISRPGELKEESVSVHAGAHTCRQTNFKHSPIAWRTSTRSSRSRGSAGLAPAIVAWSCMCICRLPKGTV